MERKEQQNKVSLTLVYIGLEGLKQQETKNDKARREGSKFGITS